MSERKVNQDNSNSFTSENKQVVYGGIIRGSLFESSYSPGVTPNYDDILDLSRFKADSMLEDQLLEDQFELPISIKGLYESTKQGQLGVPVNKEAKTPKFTLDDAKKLINEMEKKNIVKPRDYFLNIPFIGRKLYEKAWFEQKKIEVLKEQLEKAENGTELDKRRFIDELEPLLAKGSSKVKTVINSKQDK